MTWLERLAKAIKRHEGWFPFSRSWRNNNPGNLRYSPFQQGIRGGFAYFDSYETGWKALLWDLEHKCSGKTRTNLTPNSSLLELFKIWAPSADRNNPIHYTRMVADELEISMTTPLSWFIESHARGERYTKNHPDQILCLVSKGDTLSGIALRFGVRTENIMRVNPIIKDPNLIKIGWILRIPKEGFAAEVWYKVKWGDTLGQIASKFKTPMSKIMERNFFIKDPSRIRAGWNLRIK